MKLTEEDVKKAAEKLAEERAKLIPLYVTFPAEIVREVLESDPKAVRYQLGILDGNIVGFLTPVDAAGAACGSPLDSGAPCPPFCD